MLLKFLLVPLHSKNAPDRGFTLIESLMGIVILTLILVSLFPPLALIVATRVQNRRAEQAMQLAQGEVDRIRVLVEQGIFNPADPSILPGNTTASSVAEVDAPSTIRNGVRSTSPDCTPIEDNQDIQFTQAIQIDLDGDCNADFLLQTFRIDENAPGLPLGKFKLGVRVYAASARRNLGSLNTEQASLKLTTGEGGQATYPLAVIATDVIQSDREYALCHLKPDAPGCNVQP